MNKYIFQIALLFSLVIHGVLIIDLVGRDVKEKQISFSVENIQDGVRKINFMVKNQVEKIFKKNKSKNKESKINKENENRDKQQVLDHTAQNDLISGGVNTNLAKFLDIVRNEILKNKTYPVIAKRLKQEGETLIYFEIAESGSINNIRIEKSSGFKLLDNASIEAVTRVEIENHIKTTDLSFPVISQISINYRLTE